MLSKLQNGESIDLSEFTKKYDDVRTIKTGNREHKCLSCNEILFPKHGRGKKNSPCDHWSHGPGSSCSGPSKESDKHNFVKNLVTGRVTGPNER